jgi:hypothetical protein
MLVEQLTVDGLTSSRNAAAQKIGFSTTAKAVKSARPAR